MIDIIKYFLLLSVGFLAFEGAYTTETANIQNAQRKESQFCLSDDSVFEELAQKRAELKKVREDLQKREIELDNREKMINEKISELDVLKKDIESARTVKAEKNEEKVVKLVETIQKMSPKAASKLLSQVSSDLAVTAIARIETDRLAKIMNLMDIKKSSELSELLTNYKSLNEGVTQ